MRSMIMYKDKNDDYVKCRKCGKNIYVTNLERRLFCKKCFEYKKMIK